MKVKEEKIGKWEVVLVGSELCATYEMQNRDEAVKKLREEYNSVLEKYGDSFDEMVCTDEESRITGEEFAQFGKIRPVNFYCGLPETVQKISDCADDAADYALVYEYELMDMQDVFNLIGKARSMCEDLKEQLLHEDSYIDILSKLAEMVNTDQTMPEEDKGKILALTDQLQNQLEKYSA
jgi:hypothetical protein